MFVLAGVQDAPRRQQSEGPFYLLGKVVMQQSYVCALIAMMVSLTMLSYEAALMHYDPAVSQHHSGVGTDADLDPSRFGASRTTAG